MNSSEYIKVMRKIQSNILKFLEKGDESAEKNFKRLKKLLISQKYDDKNNIEKLEEFIRLICNISSKCYRFPHFYEKIDRILLLIKDDIINNISNDKIYPLFSSNKRVVLFLIKENILTIDETVLDQIYENTFYNHHRYFAPEIKLFTKNKEKSKKGHKKESTSSRANIDNEYSESFFKNREEGENENAICKLIRDDSVEDFIILLNKNNISVNSNIPSSIFETNKGLISEVYEETSLIEYAAFFGSIQIFQYLQFNNVKINPKIWYHSIHGRNGEIIHLLEELKIESPDKDFIKCYKESIKCYNDDIANYIKDVLIRNKIYRISYKYQNYNNYTKKESISYIVYNLCKSQLYYNAKLFLIENNVNPNFLFKLEDYEKIEEISNSPSSRSYLIKKKSTGKKYFLKKTTACKTLQHQITIMYNIKYPSLIKIKGYCDSSLLYHYYKNGSLYEYLQTKDKQTDTRNYILILGISITLKFLNHYGIIMFLLHPENILLNKNFYPILSDFAYDLNVDIMLNSMTGLHRPYRHFYYFPPEFIYDDFDHFDVLSNIFSLSYLIYQLLTGNQIFNRKITYGNLIRSVKKLRPDVSMIKNDKIVRFFENCWQNEVDKRLNIDQVIDFITSKNFISYFESINFDEVVEYLDIFGDEYDDLKKKFK